MSRASRPHRMNLIVASVAMFGSLIWPVLAWATCCCVRFDLDGTESTAVVCCQCVDETDASACDPLSKGVESSPSCQCDLQDAGAATAPTVASFSPSEEADDAFIGSLSDHWRSNRSMVAANAPYTLLGWLPVDPAQQVCALLSRWRK